MMSRCRSCDKVLNDYEMTRKSAVTGEYYDLCGHCFSTIKADVYYKERVDLMDISDDLQESDEEDLTEWQ